MRPGRDSDGDDIAALIARIFAEYEGCFFDRAEFPELKAPASHYASKGGRLWVAEQDGAVVATTAVFVNREPDAFEIGKVYVAAQLRGSGLAQKLLSLALTEARERKGREMVLYSDTRFTRAHAFYERLGFVRLPGVRLLHDISHTLEFGFRLPLKAGDAV
ncbi:GNAT family N-acetyltransferase [Terrarubrum flagellatum]|uniref:GNAT family N-acetyltransferase n=1 Tax=Terrirubrum flagellatum TaxID=2895980 RepID=UPI0031455AAD